MPNKKRNRNNTISGQRIDDDLNVNLSKNAQRRNKKKNKKVDNDTPREFLRILKYKEILENKKKEKQKNKNNEQSNKDSVNELKIQKGETLGAFSKRVEDECRVSILKAQTIDTKKKQKRKNFLINKKLKKMNKLKKNEGFSFDDLKDNVKFGEQAYEPPTINVVPKKRKLNNNSIDIDNKIVEKNEKKIDKEVNKLSKPKLKTLSLIERKHLIDEREKVISNYRKIKQRKLQQYNPFEAEKDDFEYDPNDFL